MRINCFKDSWFQYPILLGVSFTFIYLFSCTTSPFYDGYPFYFYGDAGVFQQMGLCLIKGGTPYVDLFDHKGPILFFIQALGLYINRDWGLVILQVINLFVTLILWKETIQLINNRVWVKWTILSVSLFILWMFYQRGDLCEEWSLPFISFPIYLYLKRYYQNKQYCYRDVFLVGLCFSVLAFIRLNNAATFLGFIVYFLITLLYNKQWKRFLWSGFFLILSLIVVAIPNVLLYYLRAGISGVIEMLFGTFVFNFLYLTNSSHLSILENIQYFIPIVGGAILVLLCLRDDNLPITMPILLSYLIGFLTIGLMHFYHYLMTFVPLLVLSFALFTIRRSKFGYCIVLCIFLQSSFAGYSAIDCFVFRAMGKTPETSDNEAFHEFTLSLSEDERNSIWNYNLVTKWPEIFADEGIVQCNRFLTECHISQAHRFSEYASTHSIIKENPMCIIVKDIDHISMEDRTYITKNYLLRNSFTSEDVIISCFVRREI